MLTTKGRVRTGYQIFSSQIWLRVKSEMASGNFAEISREIGNQVNQYLPSFLVDIVPQKKIETHL